MFKIELKHSNKEERQKIKDIIKEKVNIEENELLKNTKFDNVEIDLFGGIGFRIEFQVKGARLNQFVIKGDFKSEEDFGVGVLDIRLETTYSNQVITPEYMEALIFLKEEVLNKIYLDILFSSQSEGLLTNGN